MAAPSGDVNVENVLKKLNSATKSSNFFKGFFSGSVATLTVVAASVYYVYYEEEAKKRRNNIRGHEILKYGFPESPRLLYYTNHVLAYDTNRKTPIWVAEHITKESLEGNASRKYSKFRPDPNLLPIFTPNNGDYRGSGWSRGHMAPAGNNKNNQEAMDDTFFLTNVIPQDVENNTGFWNRVEIYTRDLAKKFSDIRIISGPMYLPHVAENGKKYVVNEVIGESNIAVPSHLFKVIVAENAGKQLLGAFVVPNTPIPSQQELKDYQVPLDKLEKDMGIRFMSRLNREKALDLCAEESCQLLSKTEFSRYYISRKIRVAPNRNRLDQIWKEIKSHGLIKDTQLLDVYQKRKVELDADEERKKKEAKHR